MVRDARKSVEVYVRLLGEGTDVSRPTLATPLSKGGYELHEVPDFDPEDEQWEFPPGSVVVLGREDDHLVVVGLLQDR